MTELIAPAVLTVFTLSDSSGATAESVAKAVVAQFPTERVDVYRLASVSSIEEIKELVHNISKKNGLIVYTLVRTDLRNALESEAGKYGIPVIDLLGPMIAKIAHMIQLSPLSQAGRLHLLDESYYKRIAAIDFAIRYDDGKNASGLPEADVILIGVSRTSKTPTCMYLAQYWGLRAANVPLVHGIEPPAKLFTVSNKKIIGLTINPDLLLEIRTSRAYVLGLSHGTGYTDPETIKQEVNYANRLFEQLDCRVIDVSNKAIEETSGEIYLYLRK